MGETLSIPRRFSGPPGVGNGGYACGRFAALVGGVGEVTLRRPVPLETPLEIHWEEKAVRLCDGEQLVAEVVPANLAEIVAPPPVTLEQAVVGASHFPFTSHPFPTCFVCGPRREELDGLRIHAWTVSGTKVVASPWVPSLSFVDASGHIPAEIVWAALDCPTGWAGLVSLPDDVAVLGRLAVRIDTPVGADRPFVITASSMGREGRKLFAAAGLYTPDGKLCAAARATWLLVKG